MRLKKISFRALAHPFAIFADPSGTCPFDRHLPSNFVALANLGQSPKVVVVKRVRSN